MAFLSSTSCTMLYPSAKSDWLHSKCVRKCARASEHHRSGGTATMNLGGNSRGSPLEDFDITDQPLTANLRSRELDYGSGKGTFYNVSDVQISELGDGVVDVIGGDYDVVQEKTKKIRSRTKALLQEIDTKREHDDIACDANDFPPVQNDETMPYVRTAVLAGDERKAIDPVAIRVAKFTYVTSFIVVMSGKSTPQLKAIANLVEEKMFKEHGLDTKRSAGTPQCGWILLDYGDLIVNVFSPEQRENYDIEGLWGGCEFADISDCIQAAPDVEQSNENDSLDDWIS